MSISRRNMLKGLATAGATVAAAPVTALASKPKTLAPDAVGLLYDATKCIGCKACMSACRENAGLEPDARETLWDDPLNLNANAKNIIKLYKGENGAESFMKMQCMQCVDPACTSVCMLGALHKNEKTGVVEYNADRCIGCRYCQVACPFNVPAFEWKSNSPQIVKCELCRNRLEEGKEPACVDVCPRDAVIFGKVDDLLKDAHARIAAQPEKYDAKVYGEKDGGGTQVLYLTSKQVSFASLGLPDLGEKSVPSLPEKIQHTIYKGFAAPVALYAVLGAVVFRNRKRGKEEEVES
jgi:Fe-S-cluster-containing dehydrogenase component